MSPARAGKDRARPGWIAFMPSKSAKEVGVSSTPGRFRHGLRAESPEQGTARVAKGLIAGDWTDLNPGCVDATVTTVQILIDNQSFDADCVGPNSVPGVQIQTFAPGSYPYTILGFRNSEEIFADGGTVTVVGG